ncbi:MAG: mandelate racemase/muconate lactonizing enzyme family protein [Bryobacterales bacterium]|nr:mandelate racemase/muconate lactonizing enzyme family protein [Bryobacterales bacterium]
MVSRRSFLAAAAVAAAPRSSPLDGVRRENLKITDVRVTLLSCRLPPGKTWVTGRNECWKTDAVLVQVFTDKGLVGIGESTQYGGPELIKKFVEEQIKPRLLGKNPFDVEHLSCVWGSAQFGEQVAWAGVDAACWDIIGKALNQPVYQLLAAGGKPSPRIRMYASGGVEYAWYKRPEDLIDEAVRHKEEGYTAFKFRIGTEWAASGITIRKYVPFLYKMRQAVGPGFDLMQESNMRLTLEQCLELCPVLRELKFLWFEEPVNRRAEGAIEGHLKIREALRGEVMVSGGETMVTRFDFKPWVDRGAYDIVQPDCNTTGVSEAWHIARMAGLQGRKCCPHNWHGGLTTMANAALVAGIPNHLVLELNQTFNPLKEEVFREPLVVKQGYLQLPAKPGFGVELASGLERKFPFVPGHHYRPNPNLPA